MDSQIEQQLEKIMPEDLARTFESAFHVIQGRHEHMDDLLKHGGVLLRKAAHKFTPTQMVLGVAALATVAIIFIGREINKEGEGEAQDVTPREDKRQLAGSHSKGNGNK
ncbi:hypothetical protein I2I05_00925 [Hymenobacter sp. BT683]|uniref:DUF3618 domain-containing protein n=1 Tax=Hymenobacter jeongseonensis TaxID=2791027 RepID=A0ABS0ICP8_9BACT|nr:hypothetical protein [Hymenobacter jeongseonensis]MBF9235947.1 hypothetical protein [Hymenobacter jeongseonensis]